MATFRVPAGAGRVYVSYAHGTKYYNPWEADGEGVPERVEAIFPACTLVGLRVSVAYNTLNGTLEFILRKDGVMQPATYLQVPAGSTGIFSKDFSVSVADGQRVCLLIKENATSGYAYLAFTIIMEYTV